MTADVDWDPTSYDNVISDLHKFYDQDIDVVPHLNFDALGNHLHRMVATHLVQPEPEYFDVHEFLEFDDIIDDIVESLNTSLVEDIYLVNNLDVRKSPQDYNLLRPFFAWAPADTIQKTLGVTTQYARGRVSDTLRQHWKSRFPACNVRRRIEAVATDTIFSDAPAVDSGVKAAQLFIGRSSLVADVYGVKTDKDFVNTLEDNIHERGAMDKLISDCARAETSNRIKDTLLALVISDWQSEPYHENQNFAKNWYATIKACARAETSDCIKDILLALFISDWQSEHYHENQNFAENRYATIKAATNRVLNQSGAPADCWLLAVQYVYHVLNHLASSTLKWTPSLQVLTGQTKDIFALLVCAFWELVYYNPHSVGFPSIRNESKGIGLELPTMLVMH
jgi:hypothetical protein